MPVVEFADAVDRLRGWAGEPVVVVLEPDHSVMAGRLRELDSTGTDGALFALDHADRPATGVAVALFRDAFEGAELDAGDRALRVRQGRVEIIVTRQGSAAASPPGR